MKRFLLTLSLFFSSFFALNAEPQSNWLYNVGLGAGSVFLRTENSGENAYELDITGYGFNIVTKGQIIHKRSNILLEGEIAMGSHTIESLYYGDGETGFAFNALAGMGYAFINNSRCILTLSGIFGIDVSYITRLFDVEVSDENYNVLGYTELDLTAIPLMMFLGFNVTGTYRITERFGLFASFLAAYPVGGSVSIKGKYGENKEERLSDKISLYADGYIFKPSIGIFITFE
ncbi:MAG: hypothetical protein K5873_06665 [Treponema sp.]|nr:hypothetical protein [Treponema sp.]